MSYAPQEIVGRVQLLRTRNSKRDKCARDLLAIRRGDYEAVAPGLFNTSAFDRPLIANLIDTTARDIAEVMAPLPSINCESPALTKPRVQEKNQLRASIASGYVQRSRLQDQMFGGADRYGSFGFMAYIVEPDFEERLPLIRVGDVATSYYVNDYRGRTRQYCEVLRVPADALCHAYPEHDLKPKLQARYGRFDNNLEVDVIRWYDDDCQSYILMDPCIELLRVENLTDRCPVRVVERPSIVQGEVRGQYDDVIWVQIARALVQVYTMDALEQSVHAPIATPKDVNEIDIGPLTVLQSDQPEKIGRINLGISNGLFPEFSTLAQEQRMGSRYPEGRSGSMDASIITGQGVQALMGTFDTQVQTFQRLNASAMEDVIAMCFQMDERVWGNVEKTVQIRENGAPVKFTYVPSKDIAGEHAVDVTYGAIAGLDPNRGLVFVLQALAGGLIAKSTARKTLPVELNVLAEERQIQLEQMDDSIAASVAMLPQAIPQMAAGGQDPRELVMQISELRKQIQQGIAPADAILTVFAPKQPPADQQAPPSPMEQAQQGAPLPGAGGGGAGDLLMSLAGMTPSGNANLQSSVSRMRPAQG